MDLTKGNVDKHFGKIAIQVDPLGHDLFERVSNGIKAGDQSVTEKEIREALMFLANVQYDLQRKMETLEEGSVNVTYYATAVDKCSSCTLGLH
jgi:hypothetical protein